MRLVPLIGLLSALATGVSAQDADCVARVTSAIANEDAAALDRLITNETDRKIVLIARGQLQDMSDLFEKERNRLEQLSNLRVFGVPLDDDQKYMVTDIETEASKSYRTAEALMVTYGRQLEEIVKRACAGEAETAVATAVLELIDMYPTPRGPEWTKSDDGKAWSFQKDGTFFVVSDGRVVYSTKGMKAIFTWTPPPKSFDAKGFPLSLNVQASSTGVTFNASTHAQSRYFLFDPDPAQTAVFVAGNENGNKVSTTVKPPGELVYDGLNHEINIGGDFLAGLTYVYSVPQPKTPTR